MKACYQQQSCSAEETLLTKIDMQKEIDSHESFSHVKQETLRVILHYSLFLYREIAIIEFLTRK